MAQQRLSMQKIKDVLRLHLLGGVNSRRQLARAVGCGKSAVSDCLRRARVAGLIAWGQIADLDEEQLAAQLYRSASTPVARISSRPLPDWARVREELALGPEDYSGKPHHQLSSNRRVMELRKIPQFAERDSQ